MASRKKVTAASIAEDLSRLETPKPGPTPTLTPASTPEPAAQAAPERDPREPAYKVLCGLCGAQVPEEETDTFLDPKTGIANLRCKDCRQARQLPPPPPPTPAVAVAPAKAEAPAVAVAPVAGAPEGKASELKAALDKARSLQFAAEQRAVEAVRELEAAKRDYARASKHLEQQLTEKRQLVQALMDRLRDYEVLLGFDPPVTEDRMLTQVQPWMLEIAAEAARSAPAALDEKRLTALVVDAIVEAYAQRTLEATAIVTTLTATAAGAPLFELEKAVRLVSDMIAHHPEKPAEDRKEALIAAWEQLNVHTRASRAQVEEEVRRLLAQERIERYQATAVAQVMQPQGRTIAMVRDDDEEESWDG